MRDKYVNMEQITLHFHIIVLHVDVNKSHVNMIMLHIGDR